MEYDYSYLSSLLREMAADPGGADSRDARAALFMATDKSIRKIVAPILGQEYLIQDCFQQLYVPVFKGSDYPRCGRAFVKYLRRTAEQTARALASGQPSDGKVSAYMGLSEEERLYRYISRAADVEVSSVPLSTLSAHSDYRKNRALILRSSALLAVAVILLIPLYFLNPELILSETPGEDGEWSSSYSLRVDSFFPIDSIVATVDGRSVPVQQTGEGEYTVLPDGSGTLYVDVKLISRGEAAVCAEVTHSDRINPTLTAYEYNEGRLTLTLEDSDSGVDFENVYAEQAHPAGDPVVVRPVSFDETLGQVIFEGLYNGASIYVPDVAGNVAQIIYYAS